MTLRDEPVPSPCVHVCVLDPDGRACSACRRTLAEITGWARMDAPARRAVWERLRAEGNG